MYNGWDMNMKLSDEWVTKTSAFVDRAFLLSKVNKVWCLCSRCQNMRCLDKTIVSMHMCWHGFVPHYELWRHHSELGHQVVEEETDDYSTEVDRMDEMLEDLQPKFIKDPPTTELEMFFEILKASRKPLHEHTDVTLLAFMTMLMAIKSKYLFSDNCYNDVIQLISDILRKPHKMPKDMYQSKKLVSVFLHWQDIGWSRSRLLVLRWSYEQ
jgi:hypothetical protein